MPTFYAGAITILTAAPYLIGFWSARQMKNPDEWAILFVKRFKNLLQVCVILGVLSSFVFGLQAGMIVLLVCGGILSVYFLGGVTSFLRRVNLRGRQIPRD